MVDREGDVLWFDGEFVSEWWTDMGMYCDLMRSLFLSGGQRWGCTVI